MSPLAVAVAIAVLGGIGAQGVKEVCYKHLGCFHNSYPFNHFSYLPQSPQAMGLKFLLYTRSNRLSADVLSYANESALLNSHFDPGLPVKIVIHGYLSSTKRPWMNELKDALLEKGSYNIVLVDWSWGSGFNYFQSAPNTRVLAAAVKRLVDLMIATGISWDSVHLIGHSLGAQASAMVGHASGSKVGRISGMDPAGPSFEGRDLSIRLDQGDAKFVDVIHTNMKPFELYTGYGTANPSGHVDFYPNGGAKQPGCALSGKMGCSHKRSHDFYVDSVKYKCPFVAFPCQSYEKFENGECHGCPSTGCALMGFDADKTKSHGAFYLDTRSYRPYCGYSYVVTITPSWFADDTKGELSISVEGPNYRTPEVSVTQEEVDLTSSPVSHVVLFDRQIDDATAIKITFNKSGFFFFRPKDYSLSLISVTNPTTNKTFYTCPGTLELAHKTVESIPINRGQC